jgi:hypothetical protein
MLTKHNIKFKIHGSIPYKKIGVIKNEQEKILNKISSKLGIHFHEVINIHLYPTKNLKERLTRIRGNCHADLKTNSIHAYLSKNRTTLGYHEMVHVLTKNIGQPPKLLLEGLALWFDRSWHGMSFRQIIKKKYHPKKHYNLIKNIFSDQAFKELPTLLAYNLAGYITSSLIKQFGLAKFIKLYHNCKRRNSVKINESEFKQIYGLAFYAYIDMKLAKISN